MADIETISRRQARSRAVDFSEPVVLHESRSTRQTFIAFYVDRSSGATDLSVKVETHKKSKTTSWVIDETRSISLKEPAARKLLTELQRHLAVAAEGETGEFVVIRLDNSGPILLDGHEPESVSTALLKALGDPQIRAHVANAELGTELASALRGAIRLTEMRSAVADLREKLDSGKVREEVYQDWCDRHTWAFGNAYVMRDEVRSIGPRDQLDILLPNVMSGYRDIVELKRPDKDVLNWDEAHRNHYFSSHVSRAIGQCHRYLDVLHESAATGLRDYPEIVAYHPRATIVIGRSNNWSKERVRSLHGLNRRLNGVAVMTYDQLLAQGERLLDIVGASPPQPEEDDDPFGW